MNKRNIGKNQRATKDNQRKKPNREEGSIALEYVIISAFAALLSLAALGFVTKIVQSKTAELESQLGVSFDDFTNPFDGENP